RSDRDWSSDVCSSDLDAGIPLDLDEAVAAIAGGRTRQVDIAEVNGRVFINNSAVGLYPELVKSRELQQRILGRSKRLAMLVAGKIGRASCRERVMMSV